MENDGEWFAPKASGFGAGWPIAWQGWVLLGGYVAAVMLLSARLARRHPLLFGALVAILTALLIGIAAQHTRGGWRWRRGEEDGR